MQTVATAGARKKKKMRRRETWSMAGQRGKPSLCGKRICVFFSLFFLADTVATPQTPVSVRQVKMKMHYSSARHQLWIRRQRRGGWRRKAGVWSVCASETRHCERIHVTYFIRLVWPLSVLHVSLKFWGGDADNQNKERHRHKNTTFQSCCFFLATAAFCFL